MSLKHEEEDRQQVMFVDALGAVYANDQLRLLRSSDTLYYSKGGVYVPIGAGGGDSTTTAAYASRPAAGNDGNLFFPTNSFYVERDNGSIWQPWGPIFPMTPPVDGDFSWVNQGSATVTTTNGGIHLAAPAETAAYHMRIKTAPSAPYTITAWFKGTGGPVGGNFGLMFRQSSDSKGHLFIIGPTIASQKVDNVTFNANYTFTTVTAGGLATNGPAICVRIQDDNTNRICSYSCDGVNFTTFHTVGRTDFLTADRVGFFMASAASFNEGVTLLSWKET